NQVAQAAGDFLLVEVDIDDCPDLADKYHANSVPTVVAFVNGVQQDLFVGAHSQSYVRQFIAELPAPQQSKLT
ncbi:MAG: thioredoxin family protein, partial [Chloroflexi bacterium]|nr:thioredoxin family protein [Chloroflexota bacterium]